MTTFNLRRDTGIKPIEVKAAKEDLNPEPEAEEIQSEPCVQCNGIGAEETGRLCRKCKGAGVMEKVASAVPAMERTAEDWIPILDDDDEDEEIDFLSSEDVEEIEPPSPLKDEVSIQSGAENPIPANKGASPDQLKNNIASMLSSSASSTIGIIFDHIADTEGIDDDARKALSYSYDAINPGMMLDYIYDKVDVMDESSLRTIFAIIRENE